jgi:transcriptional regulator with XRE-family HTH domain
MKHKVTSATELGTLVRAARKSAGMRIDDLAATTRLSKQFVSDVELGKPGVQLGKVLQVLQELGAHLYIDVPESVSSQLDYAKAQISNTAKRRTSRAHKTSDAKASSVSAGEPPPSTRKKVL